MKAVNQVYVDNGSPIKYTIQDGFLNQKTRYKCLYCSEILLGEMSEAGKKIACPNCGKVLVAPGLDFQKAMDEKRAKKKLYDKEKRQKAKEKARMHKIAKARIASRAQQRLHEHKRLMRDHHGKYSDSTTSSIHQSGVHKKTSKREFSLLFPKPLLKSDIYRYKNSSYSALAYAIRLIASLSKVIWYVSYILLSLSMVLMTLAAGLFIVAFSIAPEDFAAEQIGFGVGYFLGFTFTVAVYFVFNNLFIGVSIGALEFVRMLVDNQSKTRHA